MADKNNQKKKEEKKKDIRSPLNTSLEVNPEIESAKIETPVPPPVLTPEDKEKLAQEELEGKQEAFTSLLNRINEFCNGGFILFYYGEDGQPFPVASFDSVGHAMGMQRYVENWTEAIKDLNISNMQDFLASLQPPEEEDGDGKYKDSDN